MTKVVSIKNLVVILFLVVSTGSCETDKTNEIILPNGETVTQQTVSELAEDHSIEYKQYEGFKLSYRDTILGDPIVKFKDYEENVGADVLSQSAINELKRNTVTEFVFGKIPKSRMGMDELVTYLSSKYSASKTKSIDVEDSDKAVQIINKGTGEIICTVKYIEFGVPGSFVVFRF